MEISMTSSMAVIKLLQQLFKRTARQDKTFDQYQTSFLKKLQNSYSEQSTNKLFEECSEQLNKIHVPLEEILSEGRLTASQSQLQLQRLTSLSAPVTNKIEQLKSLAQPYSIIEHHNELTDIIKIYQRVVTELNNQQSTSSTINRAQFEDIAKELQLLILTLDIGQEYVQKLDHISKKIVSSNDPFKLPQYCIRIIIIIIDSTREERRSSRHFLYTLNDSLTQFYLDFSNNLKQAESTFDEQEVRVKAIQKRSLRLKSEAESAINIESLQENVLSYVESVEQLIQAREDDKDQQLRLQFNNMVREIKELQNETKNYQNTLKQQNKQLHTDFITKIPNRAAWNEHLQTEYGNYERYHHPLNLALIDIDKFRQINDTFGHLAGDKVLNIVAQKLRNSLRKVDFIARYGGEEFALLLPEIELQQTQAALEKLCHIIKNIPFKFKKESISITISIGYSSFSKDDDVDSVFERAAQALKQAKKSGRNQVIHLPKE